MVAKKRITKKRLFTKTIEILQPILNLSDWKLVVIFSHAQNLRYTANCEAFPEYKLAKIRMNYAELSGLSYNEIISTAVHEMIHCVLWELGDWTLSLSKRDPHKLEISRKYEETAVTSFEKILLPLVIDIINKELSKQGYQCVNAAFTDFDIQHDR